MDLTPFVAVAELQHADAQLQEQEELAIVECVRRVQVYLDANYGLPERHTGLFWFSRHTRGFHFYKLSHYLVIRNDGSLFARKFGFFATTIRPWTPASCSPSTTLKLLKAFESNIMWRIRELQQELDDRRTRLASE